MATILHRTAELIRDLQEFNLIQKNDKIKYVHDKNGISIKITITRPLSNREDITMNTIEKSIQAEFGNEVTINRSDIKEDRTLVFSICQINNNIC